MKHRGSYYGYGVTERKLRASLVLARLMPVTLTRVRGRNTLGFDTNGFVTQVVLCAIFDSPQSVSP